MYCKYAENETWYSATFTTQKLKIKDEKNVHSNHARLTW